MTPRERVLTACDFRPPDRIPRFDGFWEYPETWERRVLLDMLVDAGIDGLNPLERRANMDIAAIRRKYPKLILTGGMCNTRTLVHGTREEIEAEAREIIELGREGGVVIGTHSVSPEIPLENFVIYHELCLREGVRPY